MLIGNPFLSRQRELRVLHQRDLLLQPGYQFIPPLNYRITSRQLGQRSERYGKLHDESCDHDKGEPAASDAFDFISPERATAKRFCKVKLTAGKEIHYRNSEHA